MKLTNQEIISAINALNSLEEKELPILVTYKVIDNFEKLMQSYNSYSKTLEKAKTEEEIKELLKIEKEIELEKFTKQELVESGITLTPVQLVGLKRLIDG